ncbi:hypothetical protein T4A_8324 [Trichinella pseudospiralis]|uniref:Uncharacterized protein n=1 Tax=Trichinella pseudospiralis TaxID=6337 RepID=A0A0V1AIV4_TRIPS|nr:hypothetical protein T4A_8324 [Trichinella pseudospiralis]
MHFTGLKFRKCGSRTADTWTKFKRSDNGVAFELC